MTTQMERPAVTHPAPPAHHSPWVHAAELGPVTAGAVFGAGAALNTLRVPALAVILIAVALAGSVTAAATVHHGYSWLSGWWAAAATCAAGWLAYASIVTPWSWPAVTGLAVPALLLIPLWPAIRVHQDQAADEARRRAAALAASAGARYWPDLLARIGHKGITFAGRDDSLCGYATRLTLPGSGRVTFAHLARDLEKLEVAARRRRGSLRLEAGPSAHEVVLHVVERDVLAETVPFPPPAGNLTIMRPLPIGLHEDGGECAVLLREVAVLIVGLRGSGKSNLLHVLIAQLARCTDALLFFVDLKGGRVAQPWLQPWMKGRTPHPVIDWVATSREEADRMLKACLRAIEARATAGDGRDKVLPTPQQPAIAVVVDEGSVTFGMGTGGPSTSLDGVTNAQLSRLIKQLTITGRSEAIDPIVAVQRGSVTMVGDGDFKSQFGLRIGLGVATEADARLILPDDSRIAVDLARLEHPGSGIVSQGKSGRVVPVKFYKLEHEDIGPIAEKWGWIVGALDPLTEAALGDDYAHRWDYDRAGHLAGPAPKPAPKVTAPPGSDDAEFQSIISGLRDLDEPVEDAGHPSHTRMLQLLRESGVKGMSVMAIGRALDAENMSVARQTLHRWLAEDLAAGRVIQASYGRWKWSG